MTKMPRERCDKLPDLGIRGPYSRRLAQQFRTLLVILRIIVYIVVKFITF